MANSRLRALAGLDSNEGANDRQNNLIANEINLEENIGKTVEEVETVEESEPVVADIIEETSNVVKETSVNEEKTVDSDTIAEQKKYIEYTYDDEEFKNKVFKARKLSEKNEKMISIFEAKIAYYKCAADISYKNMLRAESIKGRMNTMKFDVNTVSNTLSFAAVSPTVLALRIADVGHSEKIKKEDNSALNRSISEAEQLLALPVEEKFLELYGQGKIEENDNRVFLDIQGKFKIISKLNKMLRVMTSMTLLEEVDTVIDEFVLRMKEEREKDIKMIEVGEEQFRQFVDKALSSD